MYRFHDVGDKCVRRRAMNKLMLVWFDAFHRTFQIDRIALMIPKQKTV